MIEGLPALPRVEWLLKVDLRTAAALQPEVEHCRRCGILIGPGHLETMSQGGHCRRCLSELHQLRR